MSNSPPPELPVVLETTFNVPANGEAGPGANSNTGLGPFVGPGNLSDLINKYKRPMWVEEIRISAVNYPALGFFDIFTDTYTRILFGRYHITRDFVPTGVLAPRWPGDGHVVMRLHKPLYVTPQSLPLPTVRSNVDIQVRFTLAGRLASTLPTNAKVWVPYVSAFQGATVTRGSTSAQQSNRVDLANPFPVPLSTRFFLGRRTTNTANPIASGFANNQPPMTVRMSDHRGRPILRDPTPFYDLFNVRDQAWAVNSTIERGGYFLANVNVDATTATADQRFDISMFGYREENIQWGT